MDQSITDQVASPTVGRSLIVAKIEISMASLSSRLACFALSVTLTTEEIAFQSNLDARTHNVAFTLIAVAFFDFQLGYAHFLLQSEIKLVLTNTQSLHQPLGSLPFDPSLLIRLINSNPFPPSPSLGGLGLPEPTIGLASSILGLLGKVL
jgi:hypothetical protein